MAVKQGNDGESQRPQSTQPQTSPVLGDALRQAGISPDTFAADTPSQKEPVTPAPKPAPAVAPAAPTNTFTQQEPRMSQQTFRAPSAVNLNTLLSRPIGRRPAGEKVLQYVRKYSELADQSIQDPNQRKALQFVVLDSSNDQVLMNTILVCLFVNNGGQTAAGVFELIVEDETQRLAPLVLNNGLAQVTVQRTTADVADNELWEKARTAISNKHGVALDRIYFAGVDVIPAGSSPDDESLIQRTLYVSTQAVVTVLQDEVMAPDAYLNIQNLVKETGLQVALNYADGDAATSTGLPVRSNLSIAMTATDKSAPAPGQIQSVHRKKVELTRVDGFVDIVYNAPAAAVYGQPQKTQSLNPRFVMTRLDTQFDAITLEGQLLALASAFTASYNYAWAGAFLPRYASSAIRGGKKTTELRDLGAIGLMVPLDEKGLARHSILNTKTEDKDLQALVQYAFNPEMLFTVHVSETGDLAWLQEVFVAAAATQSGPTGNEVAYNRIVEAADRLTGGIFSQKWQVRNPTTGLLNPICFNDKIRFPIGYYTNPETGKKHDLREIDLLAVMNAVGDKDMTIVQRWQNAMDNQGMDPTRRTEEIVKIYDDIVGQGRYTLTDHVTPVTFSAEFLRVLNEAAAAAGADIRPINLAVDFSGQSGRAVYSYLSQAAVNPAALAGIFGTGGSGTGAGRQYNSQIHTRY